MQQNNQQINKSTLQINNEQNNWLTKKQPMWPVYIIIIIGNGIIIVLFFWTIITL